MCTREHYYYTDCYKFYSLVSQYKLWAFYDLSLKEDLFYIFIQYGQHLKVKHTLSDIQKIILLVKLNNVILIVCNCINLSALFVIYVDCICHSYMPS